MIDNTTFLQLEKTDVEDKLIKCGIDAVGNISWGTHFCQFYQTKEDLIEILVPYFRAGLENSEFCMWIISESLSKEEAKAALRKAVPDFDFYLERGQIEILPYTYLYIKDGIRTGKGNGSPGICLPAASHGRGNYRDALLWRKE